ncbi:MAG: 3-oxoacyl-ACP synthase [Bacteroidetes bacterium]|jgi:transcription elongation GreA/GreB family factor|nr:3-oxoacyl-ACP synthase [Bacteroidota bacterium]
MDNIDLLKCKLYDQCLEYAKNKLQVISSAMKEARDSANEDSKSSAGDKHETGRSMAQLEQEKLSFQMMEAEKLVQTMNHLERGRSSSIASSGSLVFTDEGNYYISISAGKIAIDGETYFAVSLQSPIGLILAGLKAGDTFKFNGRTLSIKKIS